MITQDDISNKFSEPIRSFLPISSIELPDTCKESVDALIEAISIIAPKILFNRKFHLVIAKSPFKIALNTGELSFVSKLNTHHVTIENFINVFNTPSACGGDSANSLSPCGRGLG